MSKTSRILLWLLVMFLGMAFGAGLYEARIVVPEWLSGSSDTGWHWNAEVVRRHDTGRRFWVFVTTVPLTLLTLANLFAAWRSEGAVRRWWLGAALLALADRVFTLSYFVPTMIQLMQAADGPEAVAAAGRWVSLNHIRHVIVLGAWLAALKAFTLMYGRRE